VAAIEFALVWIFVVEVGLEEFLDFFVGEIDLAAAFVFVFEVFVFFGLAGGGVVESLSCPFWSIVFWSFDFLFCSDVFVGFFSDIVKFFSCLF